MQHDPPWPWSLLGALAGALLGAWLIYQTSCITP